ncbi:MAG: ATP-binding protein [Bacilli bacterium]|jgi:two-component system sensor histidine kinase KdpD|nr:ATP-binding protein [Bacilli bacterium]
MKSFFKKISKKKTLLDFLFFLVVSALAIALSIGVDKLNFRAENIFMVYVVAGLILVVKTGNIFLAIVADLIFILSFNLLFTEPRYSFAMDDPNYYISFVFFIFVSLIAGSVTIKLQRESKISKANEKKIKSLYDMTNELLNCGDENETFRIVCSNIQKALGRKTAYVSEGLQLLGDSSFDIDSSKEAISYSLSHGLVVGYKENLYSSLPYKIFPVMVSDETCGAFVVEIDGNVNLTEDEASFIKSAIMHLTVIIERGKAIRQKESTKVMMERERFKNQLLRGLSHDLKTPLTSIQGGSNFLLENYDKCTDEEIKGIMADVYNQSCDLYTFVENLLNVSKFDNSNPIVRKKKEVVDEIIEETSGKFANVKVKKQIVYERQSEITMVNTQRELLIQVLYNLIDNAIKHTKPNTKINVRYYHKDGSVFFEVEDNGGGIDPKIVDKLFMDFFSLMQKSETHRDTGLGLSICKSIVEAHGGKIEGFNNEIGGATFRFNIPD